MKLELKHIAPYLPYGVNCRYKYLSNDKYTKAKLTGLTFTEIETTYKRKIKGCAGDLIGFEGNNNIHDLKFKLELRPLSDLTKEIEVNGEKFVPTEKYSDVFGINDDYLIEAMNGECGIDIEDCKNLPQYVFDWLASLHFDVSGLIEQGLAIDLNTVKN